MEHLARAAELETRVRSEVSTLERSYSDNERKIREAAEQINALNSELRRLKRDDAASLMIPLTGKQVAFDDCRESDGTMIEAKGIGYAEMLQDPYLGGDVIPGRWLKQARSQVDAAGSRDVEWFFAEPEAARKAKELFGAREKLQTIKIFVIPAEAP